MRNLLLLLSLIFFIPNAWAGQKVTGDLQVTGLVSCDNIKTSNVGLMSCNTTTYLKLDQTTPQTVTASPYLSWLTSGRIPYATTNGALTDTDDLKYLGGIIYLSNGSYKVSTTGNGLTLGSTGSITYNTGVGEGVSVSSNKKLTFDASPTDMMHFGIASADQFLLTTNKLYPYANNSLDIGDSTHKIKDLYVAGTANLGAINWTDIAPLQRDSINWDSLNQDVNSAGINWNDIQWTDQNNYPAGCSAGNAISALSDTPTCSTFLTSVASDSTWTVHGSYPAACSAGQAVTAIGDTNTCATFLTAVASDAAWTTHNSYPSACTSGQYVSAIGDTLTCGTPAGGSGVWSDETTYTELNTDYGILAEGSAVNNQAECSNEMIGTEGDCNGAGCIWAGTCTGGEVCDAQMTEQACANEACEWIPDSPQCQAAPESAIPDNVGQGFYYYPQRSSFRVGKTTGTENYDANVGIFSTAFGKNNIASGSVSFASGRENVASGAWSFAAGLTNTASATGAVAVGTSCVANQPGAVCIGRVNTVSGTGAVAMGFGNTASGEACFVVGDTSSCQGLGSISMGSMVTSVGLGSVAIGSGVNAGIDGSFAMGNNTFSQAQNATTMGYGTKAYGVNSMAVNDGTYTGHTDAFAMNASTMAAGPSTLSGGFKSVVTGSEAIGFGNNVICRGASSTCFGESNTANGKANFVAGSTNTINGLYSYAIGRDCTVSGDNSFCINLGRDTGSAGICYNAGQYPCGEDDGDETACLAHGCTYEGSNCNAPPEKPTVEPCERVPSGEYSGGQALCERMIGCTWDMENYDCSPDATCSSLVSQATCQAQTGCTWAETFTENAVTVANDGVFSVMNGNVGFGTVAPGSTLHVVGEAQISGISGDGSGKVVCIKSNGELGTCSSVVASGGTCTCG